MKKLLVLVVVVAMVAAMFVGCSAPQTEEPAADDAAATEEDAATDDAAASDDAAADDTAAADGDIFHFGRNDFCFVTAGENIFG